MTAHTVPNTQATQLAQAGPLPGTGLPSPQDTLAETNIASLDSDPGAAVRADLSLLGLDHILKLPLDLEFGVGDGDDLQEAAFPSFHDDDLPVPVFHDDDLPAPLFHEDDLPAPSLHAHDFPADLTTVSLAQLLGIQMSGDALPTVGEVVRAAFPRPPSNSSEQENREDSEAQTPDDSSDDANSEASDAAVPSHNAAGQSFNAAKPLTEQAATNNAEAAGGADEDAELLGLGLGLSEITGDGEDNAFGGFSEPAPGSSQSNGGNGSGGGTNVINGTPGDDNLNGTAGADILHGFAGNDTLDGGGDADRLDGGLGNDVLVFDPLDISIAGKNGADTLRVDTGNVDLTAFGGTMSGIEVVDLQSDAGANTVTLTAQAVLDVTDNGDTLTIAGDGGDSLDASNGWSYGGVDGGGNHIYTQAVGPKTATLVVDPDIAVNANILT